MIELAGKEDRTPIYSLADQAIFTQQMDFDSQQLLYTHLLDEETEAERAIAYRGAGRLGLQLLCSLPAVAFPCY